MLKEVFHRLFASIEARYYKPRLRIIRSLYLNFRTLPFKQALKMPIFVYGRLHLWVLNGSIEIHTDDIKRGMIKFGTLDPFNLPDGSGFISLASNNSRLVFNGPCNIDINSKIHIFSNGQIILGKYVRIRSGVRLICNGGRIKIGDYTGIPFESIVMNSSFHSVVDLNQMTTKNHIQSIEIGSKCWIGNRSTIAGGTKLKDETIVASNSYVNKDFTRLSETNQLIGGAPAKLIKSGLARVFSPTLEMKIIDYFLANSDSSVYNLDDSDIKELNSTDVDF